jgi:hypothetical protein
MPLIVIPDDEPAAMSPSRAFRKLAASSAFAGLALAIENVFSFLADESANVVV